MGTIASNPFVDKGVSRKPVFYTAQEEIQTPGVVLEILQDCLKTIHSLQAYSQEDIRRVFASVDGYQKQGITRKLQDFVETKDTLQFLLTCNKEQWEKVKVTERDGNRQKPQTMADMSAKVAQHSVKETTAYAIKIFEENATLRRRLDGDPKHVLMTETLKRVGRANTHDEAVKELINRNQEITELTAELGRMLERAATKDDSIKQLMENNKQLTDRLAKEMNIKIAANETSFENISLPNRPMTIIEDYNKLISNAWLEAKTELDVNAALGSNEQLRVEILSQIVEIAEENAWILLDEAILSLKTLFIDPFVNLKPNGSPKHSSTAGACAVSRSKIKGLPSAVHIGILDLLKQTADAVDLSLLKEKIKSDTSEFIESKNVSKEVILAQPKLGLFISECSRIAWKMAFQRPPMTFKKDESKVMIGRPFTNIDQFNLAWNSQPKSTAVVQYIVHHALYHKDKLMMKGQVFVA